MYNLKQAQLEILRFDIMDYIQLVEAIFDTEMDKHFREFTTEETKTYLQHLRTINANRFRSPYLKTLFEALYRGVTIEKVYFAQCTASEWKAKLQYMAGSFLFPLSGFIGIGGLFKWLYNKTLDNTALSALHIMGVYISRKDKLFVFVNSDNVETWENDKIFSILLHEMCHAHAVQNPKDFKRLFYKEYIHKFYLAFFTNLSELFFTENSSQKPDKNTITYFATTFGETLLQLEKETDVKILNSMYKDLNKKHRRLAEIVFALFYGVYIDFDQNIQPMLHAIFFMCYQQIGVTIPRFFNHYQEIIFPSEIVCVASFVHNKRPVFLEMLNNIFR